MQASDNFDVALADIRSALDRCDGQSKTGAHIHEIITKAAPNLDIRAVVGIPTGPGALRKFIETHLHQSVRQIGNKGNDILYGIGESAVVNSSEDGSKVWKAFVSPNAVNHLFLDITNMLFVVSQSQIGAENLIEIERVNNEEHSEIRRDFCSNLKDEQRAMPQRLVIRHICAKSTAKRITKNLG